MTMKSPGQSPVPAVAVADALLSPFHSPLKGWPNDDLLLTEEARDAVREQHPEAIEVLDWPELRALFALHDEAANGQSRSDRRLGVTSVVCGVLGLVAAAVAPLTGEYERVAGLVAFGFTLVGFLLAAVHWLGAKSKSLWLGHRLMTERARALYFQLLINDLDLASRAMHDEEALGTLRQRRAAAIQKIENTKAVPQIIRRIRDDITDSDFWIDASWAAPASGKTQPSPQTDVLLSFLRDQRLGIQLAYTERKLGDSLFSSRRSLEVLRSVGDLLTFAAVGAGASVAILLLCGLGTASTPVRICLALAATASALVLGVRAISEGLGLAPDTARYEWYHAAVSRATDDFDRSDQAGKIVALRTMEGLVYREMRGFLAEHWRSRFLM